MSDRWSHDGINLECALSIEVPRCSVHRDDERSAGSQGAFQKAVVWFVPDDTELVDERRRVALGWERREFQNAGVKDDSQGRAWRVEAPVRAAWLRRAQALLLRSWHCRGSAGALVPVPATT
jgi:hypothetical protein